MNNCSRILGTSFLLLFIFTTVLYTACTKSKCEGVQCVNGGSCTDGNCICPSGYSGTTCEVKDPCYGLDCRNGATCTNGGCACTDGYTGERCELEWRSLYYKTYVGNGTDNNGSQYKDFTMRISNGGAQLKAVKVSLWEPGRTGADTLTFIVQLKVDGTFDIAPTLHKDGITTFSGNGKLTFTNASLSLVADIDAPPYAEVTMQFPDMVAQ